MKLLTYQILLTTIFILFQPNDSFCQHVISKKTIRSKTDLNDLDAKIAHWQKDLNIPNVAISIIENGRVEKSKVYGDLSNGKPAPRNMIFEVASITKVVFSTLVLKLVQKGEWNLDEPLAKYFIDPEVASNPFSKKITTRHVLSQQSGFDNWRWMNAKRVSGSFHSFSSMFVNFFSK